MCAIFLAKYTPYFFIAVLIFYWLYKKFRYQDTVLYAGYSALLGLLINYVITLFYFHNRPFMDGLGGNLIHHVADSSFPSDHTTFMLSIAFSFLFFPKTRKLGIILSFIGFIGGIARVFVGVHYPFDILGSLFIAFLAGAVVYLLRNKFKKLNQIFYKIDKIITCFCFKR